MNPNDFCIIANNCWGAEIYKRYNLPFNTPIIGLYFYPDDYLDFISDLRKNLETEIHFIRESKHIKEHKHPVGIVNGIEVHFLHYDTEEEARTKWTKRCRRVLADNSKLYFKFDDRDGASGEHIHRFHNMNLQNTICFTKESFSNYPGNFQIPMTQNSKSVMDGYDQFYVTDHLYNLDKWLRTGAITQSMGQRLNMAIRRFKIAVGLM